MKSHFVMESFLFFSQNSLCSVVVFWLAVCCALCHSLQFSYSHYRFSVVCLSVYRLLIFHSLSLHGFCLQMIFQTFFSTFYPAISFTLGYLGEKIEEEETEQTRQWVRKDDGKSYYIRSSSSSNNSTSAIIVHPKLQWKITLAAREKRNAEPQKME